MVTYVTINARGGFKKNVIKGVNKMTGEQIKLLTKMKKLIMQGKRHFEPRKDRDYVLALFELGITEEEAWNYILRLNSYYYYPDLKPFYAKSGEALVFKMKINGITAYIKLKIEEYNNEEETVCLSFHRDTKQ